LFLAKMPVPGTLGTNQRKQEADKTQENKALTFVGFSFVSCWADPFRGQRIFPVGRGLFNQE